MPDTFKIKAVKTTPKDWESKYGPMKTWLIQVEGNGEPVQLNKKAESPTPQVGDELYGNIEQTEYGQKFKSESKPFAGGGQKREYHDNSDGQRQGMCINNAANFVNSMVSADIQAHEWAEMVHSFATELYKLGDLDGQAAEADDWKTA